jgi:hypothetical protein
MNYDIIKDTSALTTIPEKAIRKLISKEIYCINDAATELRADKVSVIDLDVGLGNLAISLVDDKVVYKFVPSPELDESVKAAILNGRNLLEDALEAALVERLTNTYKDIL